MRTTFDLDDQLYRQMKLAAFDRNISVKQLVSDAVRAHLAPALAYPPAYVALPCIVAEPGCPPAALRSREALEGYLESLGEAGPAQ